MEKTIIEMALAYPFRVLNKKEIDIKKFVYILSLDNFICSPSIALKLLKFGIINGYIKRKEDKVEALFDYIKYKIPINFILPQETLKKFNLPDATWREFNIHTDNVKSMKTISAKIDNVKKTNRKENKKEKEEKANESKEGKRKSRRKRDAGMNALSDYF
ncbi:MAG: DUF2240 family protein [Candidatus Asgardarchaeia archaeon]